MWIDTHSHLDAPEFNADRSAVHARARAMGVALQIVPAVNITSCTDVIELAQHYPDCLPALGLHPVYAATHTDAHLSHLKSLLTTSSVIAVGEIGLDGFVPGLDMERQIALFIAQLKFAQHFDLPVLLHVRRSIDTVLKYLRRYPVKGGIAHAFNGSMQQAESFIQLGFKLGFGGAMTYPQALRIRALAANLPLSAIVLETDSPDISPEWAWRQRNEPAYLPRIGAVLAEIRQSSLAEIASVTGSNALTVLNLNPSIS